MSVLYLASFSPIYPITPSYSCSYPWPWLGWITIKGISLGTTAGTLVIGVALALAAFAIYDLKIDAPGLVSDIFLMMFMYAIGMKVGPQFFSGLARGGLDFVVIGLIVVFANFAIMVVGAKMLDMAPGYAAGIISLLTLDQGRFFARADWLVSLLCVVLRITLDKHHFRRLLLVGCSCSIK
jgi:putative transport protein